MWRNLPDVSKYMFTDHAISAEEHAAWFQRVTNDSSYKYWIIVCDGEDVGSIWLNDIDRRNLRCYWGFYIADPALRGKGAGSVAWHSVLNYVFEELRLNKLCGEVLAFNQVAANLHEHFGFVQEGCFRSHVCKGGTMQDVVCFGILRPEWEQRRPHIESRLRAKGLIA